LVFFQESQNCKNVCGFWAWLGAHVNAIEDPAMAMSDLPPASKTIPSGFRPLAEFVHAMKFLTRLPVPFSRTIDPPPLNQTMRMFSVVGALIGCGVAVVLIAGKYLHLPATLAGLLAAAAGMLVTGALHEDGLADTADGLGGGKTKERRLEIMRDSRIGSYGTLALIVAVGVRVSCYAALLPFTSVAILLMVAASQSFSRALVVDLLWATGPARSDGLSVYAGQPTRGVAMSAIIVGLLLSLAAGYFTHFENAVLALGLGLAVTAGIRQLAIRLIGGQTGDICGAVQVTCEVVMLMSFVATLR
jgi:adenosylcobinamide-GDP ribazoletransferase